MRLKSFFETYRSDLLVLFSYAVVTLIVTFFFVQNISHVILDGDNMLLNWIVSWNMNALLNDPTQLLQANIFYPNENTLLYTDLLLPQSIMAIPLFLLTGNKVLTYNALIVLFYFLTASGGYALAKYYTKHTYGAWIAGLILGFSTYRIISLNHFQNLSIFWIPFAILFLQLYLDTRKRRWVLLYTFFFASQALASWYNGAFLGFFTIYLLVVNYKTVIAMAKENAKRFWLDMAYSAGIFFVMIAPFAYFYFQFAASTGSAYPIDLVIKRSADFGGYFLPSPFSLYAPVMDLLGITKTRWQGNIMFLGIAPILLMAYALFKRLYKKLDRNFAIYFFGAFLFMLLSFGPFLHFLDKTLPIPLPYYIIQAIPAFQFIRVVARMGILVVLCLSISVAYILKSMNFKKKWLAYGLAAILPISLLLDSHHAHFDNKLVHETVCPPIYEEVKDNESVHAIAELPIYTYPLNRVHYIFNSSCHFKPMFNGYSGYLPEEYDLAQNVIKGFPNTTAIDYLAMIDVTHVVVHTDDYGERKEKIIQRITNHPRLTVVSQENGDYLVAITDNRTNEDHAYFADYANYEANTLAEAVNITNIEEVATVGKRKNLGVVHPSSTDENGAIYLDDVNMQNGNVLHVSLQGKSAKKKDVATVTVSAQDGTELHSETFQFNGRDSWNEKIFPIGPKAESVDVTIELDAYSKPAGVYLNSVVVYVN